MSIKLYQIAPEWANIMRALEDGYGELTPEIETSMQALVATSKEKLEQATFAMRNLDVQADMARAQAGVFADEAARCKGIADAFDAASVRLGELMAPALDIVGKVQTVAGTAYSQQKRTWAFELKPDTPFALLDETLWRQADPELNKKPLAKLAEAHPVSPEFVEILRAAKALPAKDLDQVAADAVITDSQLDKAVDKIPAEAAPALAAVRTTCQLPEEILAKATTRVITVLRAPTAAKKEASEAPETINPAA